MSKEAMTLAIVALEGIHPGNMTPMAEEAWNKAITALREALADQPAQTATYTCGVCGVSMQMEQPAQQEPVDSMGMPLSCGKPLCSPGDHHPLCKLAEQPAPVQGWKLVPVNPTPEMLKVCDEDEGSKILDGAMFAGAVWSAFLAAAPQPAQQEPVATESVLIGGATYIVPAPVAVELLRLHLEIKAAPVQHEQMAGAKKDAVFDAAIELIGTLTGMKPPPIETAPEEIFKPFRDFTEKVCSIFAAPQPAQQQEPVGHFYFDDGVWKQAQNPISFPGCTKLYTATTAQRKPLTTKEIREWWSSENGMEDCRMANLDDFEQVVRAIEAAYNIK